MGASAENETTLNSDAEMADIGCKSEEPGEAEGPNMDLV